MARYVFWNNKGGTGKTSLAVQMLCEYALQHPDRHLLAVDLCPQANLSELLLGGLVGNGGQNLQNLFAMNPRRSIGGYFQDRLPSPYQLTTAIQPASYISQPSRVNRNIPANIHLIAGDPIVELQAQAIASLSNNQIPGTDTWLAVIDWLDNLLRLAPGYHDIFIDANPSFSMYTQIALATSTRVVMPATADDSSRRAIRNAFSLIYGVHLTSTIYQQHNFATRLRGAGRALPLTHLIVKNRLTQYMGPASAYGAVLSELDNDVGVLLQSNPNLVTFTQVRGGIAEVRDFGTTGVVAFAEGCPFRRLTTGRHVISGEDTSVRADYLQNCVDAITAATRML